MNNNVNVKCTKFILWFREYGYESNIIDFNYVLHYTDLIFKTILFEIFIAIGRTYKFLQLFFIK